MAFRRPDDERSRELVASREVDDSRAQLAKLAEEGRRRQSQGVEVLRAREHAMQTRQVHTRFLGRALRSKRVGPFLTAWVAALSCMAIAITLSFGLGGLGLFAFVWVCFLWPVILGTHWILMHVWRRRDATSALAWQARLPFPLRDYVSTMSLDHSLDRLRVRIVFVSERPAPEVIDGLLAFTDPTGERLSKLVTGARQSAILRKTTDDGVPNGTASWVTDVVERVLLPLHAAYPIAFAELAEGNPNDDWGFGGASDELKALLG